jgi:hypothetical protein
MKKPIKFFALFTTVLFFAMCFSVNAFATENTLGVESPYLYGVYYDDNGDEVDGNTLAPGDYTVNIMLEGMENLSVFQYTAEYDPSVVTDISTDAVITDTYSDLSLGGIKDAEADNGMRRVVLALASTDADCTALDQGNAVAVASMDVTVTAPSGVTAIDFEDYFDFVTDPDLTFAEADYNDGIEDAYVLDTTIPTSYATYLMTADITPENELEPDTITVSGKVLIAADANGESGNFGLRGVKVYAYDNDNNVIAETVSNATGDASTWGDYELEVPAGTTQFMVGDPDTDTIANRPFTIVGNADVTGANVPVIMCDYNDDGAINGTDTGQYTNALRGAYSYYADFNIDGAVNGTDTGQYTNFLRGCKNGISYTTQLTF